MLKIMIDSLNYLDRNINTIINMSENEINLIIHKEIIIEEINNAYLLLNNQKECLNYINDHNIIIDNFLNKNIIEDFLNNDETINQNNFYINLNNLLISKEYENPYKDLIVNKINDPVIQKTIKLKNHNEIDR